MLVVDDDPDVRRTVTGALAGGGSYRIREAEDADSALSSFDRDPPELVILDLVLPGQSGIEVLRELRRRGDVPVIVLTARGDESHRVLGLELGADDYLVKPFSGLELSARVRNMLRRAHTGRSGARLRYDDLSIDTTACEARLAGEVVPLTAKEFDLLACLAGAPRQVFSVDQLLEDVWGSAPEWQAAATVKEHVHRLRRKIERDPAHPRHLVTVRGFGYRFDP